MIDYEKSRCTWQINILVASGHSQSMLFPNKCKKVKSMAKLYGVLWKSMAQMSEVCVIVSVLHSVFSSHVLCL